MSDFVRIRTENGREVSVSEEYADLVNAEVIKDVDATDPLGRVLPESGKGGRPVKPRATVKKAAAKKASTKKAASSPATSSVGVADNPPEEASK